MLKEAIEKLVSLKDNRTYEIEGLTYSDNDLNLIEKPIYRPSGRTVNSLEGIVDLIKTEISRVNCPVFVRVKDYNVVEVFTTYDKERYYRDELYNAVSDTPLFRFGWMGYEQTMIALKSQFAQNEGTEYIINLLSKITDENSVTAEDNGLTQSVEARKGIALKENVVIKPIVTLIPYRTFLEVEQPAGEFLLRLREGGEVGLFEADGGMWKLTAKRTISAYLKTELDKLVGEGKVVVTI